MEIRKAQSVFPQANTITDPLQCRPMSQSAFLLLILKKLFSVLLRLMPCICVFCALLDSDLGSVGDLMPPQAIVHSVKHNETDKREKGHLGELPEAALRFPEPPENYIEKRIYFHPSMLVYHNVPTPETPKAPYFQYQSLLSHARS